MTNRYSISNIPELLIKEIPPLNGTKKHDQAVSTLQDKLINWLRHRFLAGGEIPAIEYTADLVYQHYGLSGSSRIWALLTSFIIFVSSGNQVKVRFVKTVTPSWVLQML